MICILFCWVAHLSAVEAMLGGRPGAAVAVVAPPGWQGGCHCHASHPPGDGRPGRSTGRGSTRYPGPNTFTIELVACMHSNKDIPHAGLMMQHLALSISAITTKMPASLLELLACASRNLVAGACI